MLRSHLSILPLLLLSSLTAGPSARSQAWHPAEAAAYYPQLNTDGARIFAGDDVSDDGGACWSRYLHVQHPTSRGTSLAYHNDTVLIGYSASYRIGCNEGNWSYENYGVYRVTDGGRKRENLSFGVRVNGLVYVGGPYFIAVTGSGGDDPRYELLAGIYRTSDAGESWGRVGDAFGRIPVSDRTNHVASDRRGHAIIGSGGSVHITTDSGATWRQRVGMVYSARAVAVYDGMRYAAGDTGLAYTTDGWNTWERYESPWPIGKVHALGFAGEGVVLVGADSGLYRVEIATRQWTHVELPFMPRWPEGDRIGISELLVRNGVWMVLIGDGRGLLYRSEDGGATWRLPMCANQWVRSFARTADGHLLATDTDTSLYKEVAGYIIKSSPSNGTVWDDRRAFEFLHALGFYRRAFRLTELNDGGVIGAMGGLGYLPPGRVQWVPVFDELDDTIRYPHTRHVTGLPDGTWFAYDTAGVSYHGYCRGAGRIYYARKGPRIESAALLGPGYYVAAGDGIVYGTVDSGTTWEERSRPEGSLDRLSAFADGTIVLLTEHGIRRSGDGGRTWSAEIALNDEGLKLSVDASLLLIEPWMILVGSYRLGEDSLEYYRGLFRSDDRGETWYRWEDGLGSRQVHALGYGFEGRIVAAADRGLYHTDVLSSVGERAGGGSGLGIEEVSARYDASADVAEIRWHAGGRGLIEGEVVTLEGERVRGFMAHGEADGSGRTRIAFAGYPSGVYVVRLCDAGGACATGKVVVTR